VRGAATLVRGPLAVFLSLAACERIPDSVREAARSDAAPLIAADTAHPRPEAAAATAPPAKGGGKVEWVDAPIPTTDAAAVIRREVARAKASGRSVIVEIGASYCEPCQRFHAAATRGELDAAFPTLTVVSFSLDDEQTREAVAIAGYASSLIPLFALPKDDGTASGKQIQGSVHGTGSVDEITPRLRTLIAS
jgi:hypothetical protein